MDFGVASVAAITVICYLIGQVVKASGMDNKWIPHRLRHGGRTAGRGLHGSGGAGFSGHGPGDRPGGWHRERLCGHRRQPGGQAAE